MTSIAPYFPIIYIRGFAAALAEIENTVATPHNGIDLTGNHWH